ncbi:hypothetical protein GCM10009589_40200 [Arthrobacter pascens]
MTSIAMKAMDSPSDMRKATNTVPKKVRFSATVVGSSTSPSYQLAAAAFRGIAYVQQPLPPYGLFTADVPAWQGPAGVVSNLLPDGPAD